MKLAAVITVKDEADILGYTLAHFLAEGVDEILVADDESTDSTRDIIDTYAEHYPVLAVDLGPGYDQSVKMTRLAELAGDRGADWVICTDADELWYDPDGRTLHDWFDKCGADVVTAPMFTYEPHPDDDPDEPNPYRRMTHRASIREPMPKVAFRPAPGAVVALGNHFVTHPGTFVTGLEIGHYQWRSVAHMIHKARVGAAAAALAGIPSEHCVHWRAIAAMTDDEIVVYFRSLADRPGLIDQPAPYKGDNL